MKLIFFLILIYSAIVSAQSYQVGEFWSKKHINRSSRSAQKLKESIGEVGARATLFYIGKFNNKHWAITNNHVCPNLVRTPKKVKNRCKSQWITFHYYKNKKGNSLSGTIKSVPYIIKNLDLALLEISFDNLDTFTRAPKALTLSSQKPHLHQELISVGYGIYKNEYGSLMIEENSFECQVFSRTIRLIQDPDTVNPINYRVHSFLHGCDVSHGDSGSPILDRATHEVVGLLWTGKYPKSRDISQLGFESLPLEFLWQELNYASPSFMIKEELDSFFNHR
jgi:hypothetical protein